MIRLVGKLSNIMFQQASGHLHFRVACLCSIDEIVIISWSGGFHVRFSLSSGHYPIFGPDFLGKVILIVLAKLSSFLDRVLARAPISVF